MEGPVRAGGPLRSARSALSTALLAAANYAGVAEADSAAAPTTLELGEPEAWSSVAQGTSTPSYSLCTDDRQVAEADETQSSRAPTFASGATTEAQRIDDFSSQQPRVDGGFQRLVSDSGWPAGGTVDGAGYVQSLCAGRPFAEGSELEASPPGLYATVPAKRVSPGYPHGQRWTLWIYRSRWAFATERLVDRLGDGSGIHSARASRTEWGARTDASGVEGRDDATRFASPASATTANGPLDQDLQRSPAARGIGAAAASGGLSSEALATAKCGLELPESLGGAPGEEQRADQMAREEAVCGRSVRWVSGGAQVDERRNLRGSFCRPVDWRAVGIRSRWDAPGQVCAPVLRTLGFCRPGRKNQGGQNPRASRWGPLRSGSLRSPPRSGPQRHASAPYHCENQSCVTHVCAQSVTHVCARRPPQSSPLRKGRGGIVASALANRGSRAGRGEGERVVLQPDPPGGCRNCRTPGVHRQSHRVPCRTDCA
jgi:hypothetical protein